MRNLKKVLALVVAVAMLASMGLVASAANYTDVASNASYADAVNLLSNLGIITGYEDGTFRPDNTVTRAEAATMIVRMLNLDDEVEQADTNFTDVDADDWCSGYVNVAEANGIINGMGDGTFNPNGEVTYGQIVKMIVCALGYEPVALAHGGYLGGGYLYAGSAQVTGFTKGVAGTANGAASRATVARLIYNALEVELMDQTSFSTGINGSTYEVLEGETILTNYLELEKVDAVVVETYLSNAQYEEGDNEVALVVTKNYSEADKVAYEADEDVYYFVADGTDAATLLGYTVTAYVGENEDGDDAIFAIAAKAGKNEAVVVETDLIKEISAEEITYWKSENAKSTTTAEIQNYVGKSLETGVEVEGNIVVNGFNANYDLTATLIDEIDEIDEITLLDNDNDGDFEFIFATKANSEAYDEFVVDEVDYEEWYIRGEEDEIALDYDDESKLYTIVKDGKIVELDAVVEGDVVTVLDNSDDLNVITVYVSSVKVEGSIDEVEEEVYTIAGQELEVSPLSASVVGTLEAGDEGVYYINASGKIAYVDEVKSSAAADYVYVIGLDSEEGQFSSGNEYLVQVITAAGEVEVLTIKSKKVDVVSDVEQLDLSDDDAYTAIQDLVDLEEGTLAKIDTTAAGELSAIYFEGSEDFLATDNYAEDADNETKSYNEARGTYGVVDLTADTLVFHIDTTEEVLEDAVTVTKVGSLFVDESSYSFVAYGAEDEAADVLVVKDAKASASVEAPVMVVTKVSDVDVDDEATVKLTGIVAGEKVSVIVDPDENLTSDDFTKGDIILYAETADYATDVEVLFTDGAIAVAEDSDIVTVKDDEAVSVHFGEITDKKSKYVVIGEDEEEGKFYFADDVNVTVVNYKGASVSIEAGKLSDVSTSSRDTKSVFLKTVLDVEDEVSDIVVIIED